MSHAYQKLELALEDLQQVVDSHKKFFGDDWHKITDANGTYLIVPALDALVYGYAALEDLDHQVKTIDLNDYDVPSTPPGCQRHGLESFDPNAKCTCDDWL